MAKISMYINKMDQRVYEATYFHISKLFHVLSPRGNPSQMSNDDADKWESAKS